MSFFARTIASYTPLKRWSEYSGELPAFFLYRPLSFLLTPPLAAVRTPPTLVSALNLLLAATLPALALYCDHAPLWVGLAAVVFGVLDCVDGNLARVLAKTSRVGAYVDMLADRIFTASLAISIGILAARQNALVHGVYIGFGVALVTMLHGLCRAYVTQVLGTSPLSVPPDKPLSMRDWLVILFGGLEQLYPFFTLGLGWLGRMDIVLYIACGYTAVVFVFVQVGLVRALGR